MTNPTLRLATGLIAVTVLAACHPDPQSARGVTERFIDSHYVRIDLQAAVPFCTGVALRKLRAEQQLTQGQAIDESTRKPTVRYRLIEKKEEDANHATFVFEGIIYVEDAGTFTRKWLISTRRADDGWKVSNFEEFD
jgi:hypothetical protein